MSEYSRITMERIRQIAGESSLSLDELGLKMGYPKASARKSAWQFLNKTTDPRLSMLKKFADAVGVDIGKLLN